MTDQLPKLLEDQNARDDFIKPYFDALAEGNPEGILISDMGTVLMNVSEVFGVDPPSPDDLQKVMDDDGLKSDRYKWEEFQNKWNLGIVKLFSKLTA